MKRRALVVVALAGISLLAGFIPAGRTSALGTNKKDVRAIGLEVTQDVQTIACSDPTATCNSSLPTYGSHHYATYSGVELVAYKKTVVRLYADAVHSSREDTFVSAYLYGTRNGSPLPGSPLGTLTPGQILPEGPATVGDDQRGDAGAGFMFDLPDSWTHGTIELTAQLEPITLLLPPYGEECGGCGKNNSFDLRNVKFVDTGYINVLPVELKTHGAPAVPKPKKVLAETGTLVPLADGEFRFGSNYVMSMDVSDVANANTWGDLFPFCDPPPPGGGCGKPLDATDKDSMLSVRLEDLVIPFDVAKQAGFPVFDVAIGVNTSVRQGLDHGSLNKPSLPVDVVYAAADYSRDIPHEVGHAFGRAHAGDQCGAANPEPWPPDHKGELDSVGLDPRSKSGYPFGGVYRPLIGRALSGQGSSSKSSSKYNPNTWYDLMSYCSPLGGIGYWISAQGWNEEVDNLRQYASAHGRHITAAGKKVVPGLHVSGFVLSTGQVIPVSVTPGLVPSGTPSDAGFSAVVRSRKGAVLARATMEAVAAHVDPAGTPIVFLSGNVPLAAVARSHGDVPAAVGAFEIVDSGKTVSILERSAQAPVVRLVDPTPKTELRAGAPLVVRWVASDAEQHHLRAAIDYSDDGGKTFRPVWSGPSTGGVTLPAALLSRSSAAIVRLHVSDGFNQTVTTAGPFSVPGNPPDVEIASPEAGTSIGDDAVISLSGHAADDRGAALPDESLVWLVDGREAARGSRASVEGLAPGRHVVELAARDRSGRPGAAKVLVDVVAVTPRLLPFRTPLSASPGSKSLRLELAANVPADAVISGTGVQTTKARLDRRPQVVTIPVTPGRTPLRLLLRLGASGRSSSIVLVVAR